MVERAGGALVAGMSFAHVFLTNFAHHQAERENGVPIRVPWNRLEHSELEWRMLARLLLARVIDL